MLVASLKAFCTVGATLLLSFLLSESCLSLWGFWGRQELAWMAALAHDLSENVFQRLCSTIRALFDVKNAISPGLVKEKIDQVKTALSALIWDDIGAEHQALG